MRQPKVKNVVCCWKCTKAAGAKIKRYFKRIMAKKVRRILREEAKNI